MTMQQNSPAASSGATGSTVDPAEIAKFSKLSDEWWDPNGKMAPLHKINPLRLTYIRDAACRKFERNVKSLNCLSGLRILDDGRKVLVQHSDMTAALDTTTGAAAWRTHSPTPIRCRPTRSDGGPDPANAGAAESAARIHQA